MNKVKNYLRSDPTGIPVIFSRGNPRSTRPFIMESCEELDW